jgi:hypothetical protein
MKPLRVPVKPLRAGGWRALDSTCRRYCRSQIRTQGKNNTFSMGPGPHWISLETP